VRHPPRVYLRPVPKATKSTPRPAKKPAKKRTKTERPATKRAAAKKKAATKRPSAKQPARAVKPPVGPADPTTRRQLDTIRNVFDKLDFEYEESYDAKSDTSFFHVDTGVGELEDVRIVHQPGLLSVHARFGVLPKPEHRRELERFAARLNACLLHGCVVVTAEPRIQFRTSVSYTHVTDLEDGYVAGLIGDVIDMIETIDLPLILIAQGNPADAAIEKVLELEEASVLPPASAKKVPPRRA
jgi:hypothetical protein